MFITGIFQAITPVPDIHYTVTMCVESVTGKVCCFMCHLAHIRFTVNKGNGSEGVTEVKNNDLSPFYIVSVNRISTR